MLDTTTRLYTRTQSKTRTEKNQRSRENSTIRFKTRDILLLCDSSANLNRIIQSQRTAETQCTSNAIQVTVVAKYPLKRDLQYIDYKACDIGASSI